MTKMRRFTHAAVLTGTWVHDRPVRTLDIEDGVTPNLFANSLAPIAEVLIKETWASVNLEFPCRSPVL
jgi:hypothetical protein